MRVDGQPSVYLPVLKQGGDTNTIAVVDGVKAAVAKLFDVPANLSTKVVFDQSIFVKNAIETLLHEGAIGLVLTSLMILIFLGSFRATVAVCLSIPLSALATFIVLSTGRQFGQRHGAGRAGAGVLAPDRQLRRRAREHLPPHGELGAGARRRPRRGAGKWRCRCWRPR